jgi:hypothetical protein
MEPGELVACSEEPPLDRILCRVKEFSKGTLLRVTAVRKIH